MPAPLPALTSVNYVSVSGFTATYTNTATQAKSTFTIPAGGGPLGTLAAGNYNVTIAKTGNTTKYYFGVCDATSSLGVSATFNNVAVSSTCNTVTIFSQSQQP